MSTIQGMRYEPQLTGKHEKRKFAGSFPNPCWLSQTMPFPVPEATCLILEKTLSSVPIGDHIWFLLHEEVLESRGDVWSIFERGLHQADAKQSPSNSTLSESFRVSQMPILDRPFFWSSTLQCYDSTWLGGALSEHIRFSPHETLGFFILRTPSAPQKSGADGDRAQTSA